MKTTKINQLILKYSSTAHDLTIVPCVRIMLLRFEFIASKFIASKLWKNWVVISKLELY